MDTIFALATARGKAGVAVVRISGADAFSVASKFCDLPPMRRAGVRTVCSSDGAMLDEALVLCFEQGASFTGEPVVEFQLHGSTAIVSAVLRELGNTCARLAEPGEFTRRALENGRLDLTQVEGLADLIDAETESQRLQAQRVLSGAIGQKVDQWREALIRAASLIEVTIDFADEDVPVDVSPEVMGLLEGVVSDLRQELLGYSAAERIRDGFEVAIVGAPNVGKSTLLNRLAGREAAITSDIAGTTRDVIEVRMDLGGLPVTILDTAGVRETEDVIEAAGVRLAEVRAMAADIRVFLVEEGSSPVFEPKAGDLLLKAKDDAGLCGVSGKTGAGVDQLIANLQSVLSHRAGSAGLITRERQRVAMSSAVDSLQAGIGLVESGPDLYDLAAEEIRTAVRRLEMLVGRIDVENLLDEIFSRFCLGK
ncbi:tRNA uridine-5-carboxymethylaminomethyl(34) synthesis GTPase MnmE [Pseudoprimorskyibacter insulae]|uniref:tRNA modification GTPase MnmE n=1 Tax=Pseudoprimorskyibacter insulae TaxID=1695997 RepID=A0A2R8AU67_9RHOB|nr:tRNA uridine-5-carboxymethylaminomethyl(34) synthesis GTPase MnmE [Pseudoprimorskyibacter insulae]SPF79447.1 tRNA modification GTPase MnmE [Pseudoprimorskyibacter insulae]